MRSPQIALAWQFRRHLLLLPAMAGYLFIAGTVWPMIFGPGSSLQLDPPDGKGAAVVVPLSVTFMYFLAVFSFGLAGDLAARQSIYPARMFVLPVTTRALAGWPMVYGMAAMLSLWLITALLTRWLWGVDVLLMWHGLLAAAFLGWTQVFMWMPYGWRGLRVIVTVLWLITLDAIVILASHYEARESVMVAFLAPQLPLAYLGACYAVARARRGEVPDWPGMFARLGQIANLRPRQRAHFVSPDRAQLWFEWRQHGRTLPTWVAILLPFELATLFVPGHDTPLLVLYTLIGVLLTPPVMAGFAAAAMGKANPSGRDVYGVSAFDATRPVTTAALIAAKLKMTIWSTLAAWVLVLIATPIALIGAGQWPMVTERGHQLIESLGAPRATTLVLVVFAALMASTWKKLVQGLYIGLTGREWIIKANGFLGVALIVFILPVIEWILENEYVGAALWDAWLVIPTVLVFFKMSAAVGIAIRLHRSRLLSDRTLVTGAMCWAVAVLGLYGFLMWWISSRFFPPHLLALVAILAVPLARVSAAPLALAWNRHR